MNRTSEETDLTTGTPAEPTEAPLPVPESWLDRVLDLEIGPVAHGGHCVARADGRVVFVRHALPGERVRAVVTEDRHGSFCRADVLAVLVPSPDRVEAPCVWARAGGCGGCDYQHATPAAQRRLKADVLAEQLQRLAGVDRADFDTEVEELPGGALGWRHRMRLAVGPDGQAGLRAHRAHDVIPIADCLLAPTGMLTPVLERTWRPGDEVQVELDGDGEVHVSSGAGRDRRPVPRRVAGREWLVPPGSFWQVHPARRRRTAARGISTAARACWPRCSPTRSARRARSPWWSPTGTRCSPAPRRSPTCRGCSGGSAGWSG
jgi:predicted RNA-binding protein with TRAM domain